MLIEDRHVQGMDLVRGLRHLSFELGSGCNLAHAHPECPILEMDRWPDTSQGPITVADVVRVIDDAVAHGFAGFVGFHYYNEPLMDIDAIKAVVEASSYGRFMLWTNGLLLSRCVEDNQLLRLFRWVVISDYYPEVNATWFASLRDHYRDVRIDTFPATFDDRRSNYEGTRRASVTCWRQRLELPVDHFGNVHLCCQDWRGAVPIGNVKVAPLSEILRRPVNVRVFEGLCAGTLDAPPVCATCTSPISRETYLDLCSGFVAP